MIPRQVMRFVRYHGVVLESARGPEPSLVDHIAGGAVRGSWWSHPMSHEIFRLLQHVRASKAVLVCTLAGGKITFIHRRLWPCFVRVARRFPRHSLDRVQEVHLSSGRHQRRDIAFPDWVPKAVLDAAKDLSARDAAIELQIWLQRYGAA